MRSWRRWRLKYIHLRNQAVFVGSFLSQTWLGYDRKLAVSKCFPTAAMVGLSPQRVDRVCYSSNPDNSLRSLFKARGSAETLGAVLVIFFHFKINFRVSTRSFHDYALRNLCPHEFCAFDYAESNFTICRLYRLPFSFAAQFSQYFNFSPNGRNASFSQRTDIYVYSNERPLFNRTLEVAPSFPVI